MSNISTAINSINAELTRLQNLYAEEGRKNRILTTQYDEARAANRRLSNSLHEARESIYFNKGAEPIKDIPKPQFYSVGDKFIGSTYHEYEALHARLGTHILAQVAYGEVTLIDLEGGNRWTDILRVDDPEKIPADVFDRHFAGSSKAQWRKVS